MAGKRREGYLAGATILAATSYLCLRGLRRVESRLRRKSGAPYDPGTKPEEDRRKTASTGRDTGK